MAARVEGRLRLNPFSDHLLAFTHRGRDKVKILYWECSGFVLWYKRLEQARFSWPSAQESPIVTLTGQQLNWLLDG